MRRALLLLVGFSLLLSGPSLGAKKQKPNVILIVADDLGWGDIKRYGSKIPTPHLDRMANQGTLFTHFYVNAPVCSPSRAAFLTGRFPSELSIHQTFQLHTKLNKKRRMPDFLDPKTPTITRAFQNAGYLVGHVGKWHLGHTPDSPNLRSYGINISRSMISNSHPIYLPEKMLTTKWIIDYTIKFVQANKEKPFFAQVWLIDPHDPVMAPEELKQKRFPKLKGASANYYTIISEIDAHVGRLLAELDRLKLRNNTIVIFTSDNGPEVVYPHLEGGAGMGSAGPFRGRKRSLYDGGIRVPFIISWPGNIPQGKVDQSTVISAVDLFPSLTTLAKIPLPRVFNLSGEDLSEALLGKETKRKKPLFWERRAGISGDFLNQSPRLAMRTHRWKFFMNPRTKRTELYDLQAKLSETSDISHYYPKLVKDYSARLLKWYNTLPDKDVGIFDHKRYRWPESKKALN